VLSGQVKLFLYIGPISHDVFHPCRVYFDVFTLFLFDYVTLSPPHFAGEDKESRFLMKTWSLGRHAPPGLHGPWISGR